MPDIIDFDTGPIITGEKTAEQMGEDMLVTATASGDYTPKAVALGQDDFLPWKRGGRGEAHRRLKSVSL